MYALSFDIGSTNIKAIILKITGPKENENAQFIAKKRKKNTNFYDFYDELLKEYDIEKGQIEIIITTGTGASYLRDNIDGISVLKVDEFSAIGYGGIVLSKLDEAIIVSVGTGTTIVYSNLDVNTRLTGTGLGGGTFVGLSNALLGKSIKNNDIKRFDELVEMAKKGNRLNVDLSIGDISNVCIGDMNKDITAANFACLYREHNEHDLVSGVANLVLENIALLVRTVSRGLPIVYIGTLIIDEFMKNRIKEISDYTGDKVNFVEMADFAIAIGAWEYYLLNERKNI